MINRSSLSFARGVSSALQLPSAFHKHAKHQDHEPDSQTLSWQRRSSTHKLAPRSPSRGHSQLYFSGKISLPPRLGSHSYLASESQGWANWLACRLPLGLSVLIDHWEKLAWPGRSPAIRWMRTGLIWLGKAPRSSFWGLKCWEFGRPRQSLCLFSTLLTPQATHAAIDGTPRG